MSSIFIGELAGTATLLYLGNGVVANMLLKDTKGSGTGLLAIAAAWAFAVTIAIYVSTYFGSSGAHLNPIVTIAGCVKSGDWSLFPTFIGGQLLGAMLGQLLVWLHYKPHYEIKVRFALRFAPIQQSKIHHSILYQKLSPPP